MGYLPSIWLMSDGLMGACKIVIPSLCCLRSGNLHMQIDGSLQTYHRYANNILPMM